MRRDTAEETQREAERRAEARKRIEERRKNEEMVAETEGRTNDVDLGKYLWREVEIGPQSFINLFSH